MTDAIPEKYKNRRLSKCGKCGSNRIEVVNGKQVGSFADLFYNYCPSCGWTRAITFKAPKAKL